MDPSHTTPPPPPITLEGWTRRFYLWTLTWLLPAAAIVWAIWDARLAMSVLLGGALGLANLQLLGTAVFRLLGHRHEPSQTHQSRKIVMALAALRWIAMGLAMALILWYLAGQPEGLALGFALSLAGFVTCAVKSADTQSHAPADPEETPDNTAETLQTNVPEG